MARKSIFSRLNLTQQTLTEKLTFVSGGSSKVDLVLAPSSFTTEILLLLKANITTLAAVLKQDPLIKLIKTFAVKGSTQTYLDITNPISLASYVKIRGDRYQQDTIAASATADYYAILPIHVGVGESNNPMDISVVLPDSTDTASLKIEVQWGVAADLGTGVTINSAEIQVVQSYLSLSPEQIGAAFRTGVRVPKMTMEIVDLASLQSNLGARFDPPPKSLVNKTIFTAVDSNAVTSNAQISEIGIINTVSTRQPFKLPFMLAVQQTMAENQLLVMPTGIVSIDWGKIPGGTPDVGYDTRKVASRELQIGATVVATGGKAHLLHISIGKP